MVEILSANKIIKVKNRNDSRIGKKKRKKWQERLKKRIIIIIYVVSYLRTRNHLNKTKIILYPHKSKEIQTMNFYENEQISIHNLGGWKSHTQHGQKNRNLLSEWERVWLDLSRRIVNKTHGIKKPEITWEQN